MGRIPYEVKTQIKRDIAHGDSHRTIAQRYKISVGSVSDVRNTEIDAPGVNFVSLSDENRRITKQLHRVEDKNKVLMDLITAAAMNSPAIKPVKRGKYTPAKHQLEFHTVRSDEQVGAKVTAIDTNGIGGYNLDIYIDRLYKWADKIIQFKLEDRKSLGLNKLVISRLGDWLEGETIYPGQAFYIDASIADVIFQTVLPHEMAIMLRLASHFDTIEQFCVIGNHGRAGKKGDHHWKSSWEYMLYRTLQDKLTPQTNIKTYVSESQSMIVQHGEYKFCLDHGGHLRSNYGVPYYSMDRTYKALSNLYGMIIDVLLIGHKHTPSNLADQVLMNGSMMGGNELSVNKMKVATRASQKIFYFDETHGINRESNIYLEGKPNLVADSTGIYTPYTKGELK